MREVLDSASLSMTAFCRVNITSSGQEAILRLAGGDLRRVLNLLQVSHCS
jgi:DNA polymerase III delta prime subunit